MDEIETLLEPVEDHKSLRELLEAGVPHRGGLAQLAADLPALLGEPADPPATGSCRP